MEPTTQFFAKLKKLGVTLESETAKLLDQFEKRHDECDTGEFQTDLSETSNYRNIVWY